MSDITEIPRVNEAGDNFPCWTHTVDTNGNVLRPHIICKCGKHTNIGNHHVHEDGNVTASYYHWYEDRPEKMQGCGWHVFLKLLDYSDGEFLPENI